MGTFSNDGYKRERLEDFQLEITEGYKLIFGDNIDMSGDSQDGQIAAIMAEIFSNIDQDVESIYKSFDPSQSQGTSLSILVLLNGLTRKAKGFSTVTISVTGTDSTIIPEGKIVSTSDSGERFVISAPITISGGVGTGLAIAELSGAVQAVASTLTIIETPVTGWATVTNPSDANVGQEEESDQDLRIRRRKSTAILARNVVEAIFAKLLDIETVIAVKVLENVEDEFDEETGIRAHGIRCIIQGGTDEEIVDVIFDNKTGGSPTDGTIKSSKVNSQGQNIEIRYDRPTDSNIYITIDVTKFADYPIDGDDQIKQEIVNYFETEETSLTIGDDVIASEIYRPAYRVQGFSSSGLRIGTSASPTESDDIVIDFDGLARFDTSRIIINEV